MTDTISRPKLKITYATLRADNEELHTQFELSLIHISEPTRPY